MSKRLSTPEPREKGALLRRVGGGTGPLHLRLAGRKRYGLIHLFGLLLLIGGLWAAKESGARTDLRMRRALAREIRNIAATVPVQDLRELSFSSSDTERPEFRRLSRQLRAYAEAVGLRSLYTLALRDGQIVFGPESLLPDDPYASPPGTVYLKPSPEDVELFETGKVGVQGPVADAYSRSVRALAPVMDPLTGQVLAVIGLDVESSVWKASIRRTQWLAFLTFTLPLTVLAAGYTLMKQRHRFSPAGHRLMRHTETLTCATTLLLLTLTVASLTHLVEKKSQEELFNSLAQARALVYTEAFKQIQTGLNLLVRFFESSEHISREEFLSFCTSLMQETPVLACVWLPEVSVDGSPDLTYPVLYLTPDPPDNKKLIGLNLYSLEPCRTAIDEALRSGRATASDPMERITYPGEPTGIFVFQPVSALQQKGVAGLVVRPETLLTAPALSSVKQDSDLQVSLFEMIPGKEPLPLACSLPDCPATCWKDLRNGLFKTIPLFSFGKTYAVLIYPDPHWMADYPLRGGLTVLVTGLLLSVLLTLLITILINRPALLEKKVLQHTNELRESERRFHELAVQSRTFFWETDADGLYTYISSVVQALLGYRPEELVGRVRYFDLHPQEGREAFRQATAALGERKKPFQNLENPLRTRDGRTIWVSTNGVPLLNPDGTLKGYRGSDTDITARRQAETELREQEKRLRTTLNSIGDAVISTDTRGLLIDMNQVAEKLTGWSKTDACGKPLEEIFRIINEGSRKTVESPIVRVLSEGAIVGLANHTLLIAKDGTEIPIADSGAPIQNERGEITGVVLVFRDQTVARNSLRSVESSEARYRQLFENMSAGFALHEMIYDSQGKAVDYRFLAVNPAFEKLTGLRTNDLIGQTVKTVLPGTEPFWIERYQTVVKTGDPLEFEDYSGALDRFYSIRAFRSEPGRFATVFTDSTVQKKAKSDLLTRVNELERFNKASVGRELRMIELKKEVNALCRRLGIAEPYPVLANK